MTTTPTSLHALRKLTTLGLCLVAGAALATTTPRPTAGKQRPPPVNEVRYDQHVEATAFAQEVAQRNGWDPVWVREQIGQARHLPSVVRLVLPAPAGTPKNWGAYRARFIEPRRIQAGLRYWQAHRDTLARAEAEFGVPASLIVGVIGVETLYGQHLGQFRVLDALSTLAFDFPSAHPRAQARQALFRDELEQLLKLARQLGRDPATLRGSFAGAMGWPQFLPSSWLRYAIDFDDDGRVDLFDSQADVIGSVANYFKAFGWQTGMPTHYPVQFDRARLDLPTLLAPDIRPTFDADTFEALGVRLEGQARQHSGPMALVELENGEAPRSYVAGTQNFYVVTRYNWSSYYALAVIELGETIEVLLEPGR
ncbi:MAG TPA: lytic murein transglycosylase B [Hydrogenophaga sp.]|uniref:lytic murein transglycosylase B n=1 Tax=Hydrogenophaga sp. TaxID=1904254 RepID=UPI002D082AF4|nr:lytic murein transglycosylase B [Hydrogenophaga sp.]HMN93219.1 lytic murein transglycosylase B [Hydrogenophaga sp.]HMP11109.1 lytic murein transglycosylase B [Hydrogenophaga sp.]